MRGVKHTKESIESMIQKQLDCWIWTGVTDKDGYGRTWYQGRGNVLVHRLMYELSIGPIVSGMLILHNTNCVSRACVNPAHLRQGTHKENMEDVAKTGSKKGTKNPNAKLTEYQVNKIRRMNASGISVNELSLTFNVSRRTIHNVVNGRSWEGLPASDTGSVKTPATERVLELGEPVTELFSDESDRVSI